LKTIDTIDRSRAAAGQTGAADIRILVATETDLAQRVETNRFDGVLYDRLNFFNLFIPPLRDRKDDIPPLCSYLLRTFSDDFKKPVQSIASEVIDNFSAYHFPGNVRELAHLIERAVIITDGSTIQLKHLPGRFLEDASSSEATQPKVFLTLAELENRYIIEVLEAAGGNKSRTAETLGISRAALWRKLKQLKAEGPGQ
jgi:two-component system response regulator AtoC